MAYTDCLLLNYKGVAGKREAHGINKMQKPAATSSLVRRWCEHLFWKENQVEPDGCLKRNSDFTQVKTANLKKISAREKKKTHKSAIRVIYPFLVYLVGILIFWIQP